MKLLLDTHVLLWALANDARLTPQARRLIQDGENRVFYSIVCPWEVQIKHQRHPDKLALDGEQLVEYCRQAGFRQISLQDRHVFALGSLVRKEGAMPHRDPFDRIMICQASVEGMMLLTHDERIGEYDAPCVLVV